jgi:hypothetical protein
MEFVPKGEIRALSLIDLLLGAKHSSIASRGLVKWL